MPLQSDDLRSIIAQAIHDSLYAQARETSAFMTGDIEYQRKIIYDGEIDLDALAEVVISVLPGCDGRPA